jgi:hypothetical protein
MAMAIPTIRAFCIHNDIWNKMEVNGQRAITHLDFMGTSEGIYNVPDRLNNEWLSVYANAIQNREVHGPCYIVERKTETFPMFFDLDMKVEADGRQKNTAFLRAIMQYMIKDIARFFPSVASADMRKLLMCVVATCDDMRLDAMVKLGFHIHFPNLYIDRGMALQIHASVAAALDLNASHLTPGDETWRSILDSCVYEETGLRMIGSDKVTKCPTCKEKRALMKDCSACSSIGKVMCGRPYYVIAAIDGLGCLDRGELSRLQCDYLETVRATSIRSFGVRPDARFVRYSGCPSVIAMKQLKTKSNVTYQFNTSHTADDEGMKDMKKGAGGRITKINDISVLQVITSLVHRFHERYANTMIKRASYTSGKKMEVWVTVSGEGSSYCGSVCRDHSSNTVYFSVTREGLTQRCFSKKHCASYTSSRVGLTAYERDMIFSIKGKKRAREEQRTVGSCRREQERIEMQYKLTTMERKLMNLAKLS